MHFEHTQTNRDDTFAVKNRKLMSNTVQHSTRTLTGGERTITLSFNLFVICSSGFVRELKMGEDNDKFFLIHTLHGVNRFFFDLGAFILSSATKQKQNETKNYMKLSESMSFVIKLIRSSGNSE